MSHNVGDPFAREIHVRHFGMRIGQESREEDFILCTTEATRRIGIHLRLIGRDQMAGAPALGDDLAFRRIASESAVR